MMQQNGTEMPWQLRGACGDNDPELFFPVGTTGPARLQIEEAKEVCRSCEVTEVCLQWALEHKVGDGIWGGTSEEERRSILRRRTRAAKTAEHLVGELIASDVARPHWP